MYASTCTCSFMPPPGMYSTLGTFIDTLSMNAFCARYIIHPPLTHALTYTHSSHILIHPPFTAHTHPHASTPNNSHTLTYTHPSHTLIHSHILTYTRPLTAHMDVSAYPLLCELHQRRGAHDQLPATITRGTSTIGCLPPHSNSGDLLVCTAWRSQGVTVEHNERGPSNHIPGGTKVRGVVVEMITT